MLGFVKRHLKGFYMSVSMFCAIPLPGVIWDDRCLNLVLMYFPIVGVVIGLLWMLAAKLMILLSMPVMVAAALTSLVPFFATGFIHLDGYMDTSDAILSRRPLEDKLRILKDPHTGAFAVIMLAALILLQFAAVYSLIEKKASFEMLAFICVISRCCAAIAIVCKKPMKQSGYASMFKKSTGAWHIVFLVFIALVTIAASYVTAGNSGIVVSALTALGAVGALAFAYGDLKGMSGDLAGFTVVISELIGLLALSVI